MRKTIFKILVISIAICLLAKCDKYEFPRSPYPRVKTLDVTNISSTGVKLRGNLIQLGETSITDHGFVWGFVADVTHVVGSEGILTLGTATSTGTFEGQVVSGLFKGKSYYVRAFVSTESYKVYGAPMEFKSNGSIPPTIGNFEPAMGTWGDTIAIHGSYFGLAPKSNIVKFGQREAKVIEASESTLLCIVPPNIEELEVSITVQVTETTVQASKPFQLTVPIISGFSPTSGTFLDEVTITGSNFGANSYNQRVTFGGHRAQIVKGSKTSITVRVPMEVELQMNEISVQYNAQSGTASSQFNILGPVVVSLSNEEGRVGDKIELIGQNFNPRLLGNEVLFGDNKATVVSATGQSLIVEVPEGVYPDRTISVKVTVAEQTATSGTLFNLLDP